MAQGSTAMKLSCNTTTTYHQHLNSPTLHDCPMLFILSAPSLILQKIREVWIFLSFLYIQSMLAILGKLGARNVWGERVTGLIRRVYGFSVIACSLSRFEGDDHNIQGESDETHHFVHFQKSTSKLRSSM